MMIESLVKQYNDIASDKFEVYSHESGDRIDVIPAKSYQRPLLNTPVVIESESLSVEEVINSTLNQLSKVSGNCLERGGFVENSLVAKKVQLKTSRPTPAREILAQALDQLGMKRIWLLTYEPQGSCFAFGVFYVQGLVDGQVQPMRQSHN